MYLLRVSGSAPREKLLKWKRDADESNFRFEVIVCFWKAHLPLQWKLLFFVTFVSTIPPHGYVLREALATHNLSLCLAPFHLPTNQTVTLYFFFPSLQLPSCNGYLFKQHSSFFADSQTFRRLAKQNKN